MIIVSDKRIFTILLFLYPINYILFSSLRPVDFAIFAALIYKIFSGGFKKIFLLNVILPVFLCLFISYLYGLIFMSGGIVDSRGIGMLFKYIEFLMLIVLCVSLNISSDDRKILIKQAAAVFIFMLVYSLARFGVILLGLRTASSLGGLRPDFPFTKVNVEAGLRNAGHLFGAYLCSGGVGLIIFFLEIRKKIFLSLLVFALVIGSIILSGFNGCQ